MYLYVKKNPIINIDILGFSQDFAESSKWVAAYIGKGGKDAWKR